MVSIDKDCKLQTSFGSLKHCYGIGLGYGLSTSDSSILSEKIPGRLVR